MNDKNKIIHKGSIPVYRQLVDILIKQIASGIYMPGSQIPSESMLCEKYNVSPMTVRHTIKTMVDKGIIVTIKGSGAYVNVPDLTGVTYKLDEASKIFCDGQTKVKILDAVLIDADKKIADKLGIKEGEESIYIRRALIRDGEPIIYHKENLIYDPERPIVEAEFKLTSLNGLFTKNGETNLKNGVLEVEAVVLSKEEADVLDTLELMPAFRLEHIFYDFQDRPISWGWVIFRGDRFKFSSRVGIYQQI